jgi:hypothetical protein
VEGLAAREAPHCTTHAVAGSRANVHGLLERCPSMLLSRWWCPFLLQRRGGVPRVQRRGGGRGRPHCAGGRLGVAFHSLSVAFHTWLLHASGPWAGTASFFTNRLACHVFSQQATLSHHTPCFYCCAVCLLQCNKCRVFVHMTCYGVRQAPNGNLWLCDACSLGLQRPPPCALCPGPCLFAFPGTGFQATSAMVGGCAEAFG